MNREIKFRVWDKHGKGMTFPETTLKALPYFLANDYPVMQFTGIKDENDKEIFEGDICEFTDDDFGSKWAIIYDEKQAAFCIDTGDNFPEPLADLEVKYFKIIGNIYENPEIINS